MAVGPLVQQEFFVTGFFPNCPRNAPGFVQKYDLKCIGCIRECSPKNPDARHSHHVCWPTLQSSSQHPADHPGNMQMASASAQLQIHECQGKRWCLHEAMMALVRGTAALHKHAPIDCPQANWVHQHCVNPEHGKSMMQERAALLMKPWKQDHLKQARAPLPQGCLLFPKFHQGSEEQAQSKAASRFEGCSSAA